MSDFESCKVLVVGRELERFEQQDGTAGYRPSPEMIRRADEAGMFWRANAAKIKSIVCTGGFPGAALGMPKPPEGTNEGTFLKGILVDVWRVPSKKIAVEGVSRDTFGNFSESIKKGFLRPGEFSPDRPLVLSTNTPHAWRLRMLATAALLIPEGGLYRLRHGVVEGSEYYRKELRLAKVTQLAIEHAEIEQGHPDFVAHVQTIFRRLWLGDDSSEEAGREARARAFAEFQATHDEPWVPPDIPILEYPVFPRPAVTYPIPG